MAAVIDRRKNLRGKSSHNRQRFVNRSKEAIREAVKEAVKGRKIDDIDSGENVNISREGIREPSFNHDYTTGRKAIVKPGNKVYRAGDKIRKPPGGEGQGGDGDGDRQGSEDEQLGEDDFEFVLSKKEFYDIFFEDLELPNLQDKDMIEIERYKSERVGFRTQGNMCNMDVIQSYRRSLGRRIALKRPKRKELENLQEEIENETDPAKLIALTKKLIELEKKFKRVPLFDYSDMRYRNYEMKPQPNNKAVMFCLMDTSYSMGEHEKDLSKRFFMLLYMFLERKYEHTELVFIRHHTSAHECNEDEFFHSTETGGTTVSSVIDLTAEVIKDRYPSSEWNIYVAQCSDGDNSSSLDTQYCVDVIKEKILPVCQYYAYIQTEYNRDDTWYGSYFDAEYSLWTKYKLLDEEFKHFEMRQVSAIPDIWKVFIELFKKKEV